MQQTMKTLRLCVFCALLSVSVRAGEVSEIPKGSELRAQLFDLARPSVEKLAGRPVKFQGSLKREGDWAFFYGSVVDAAGKPVLVGESESSEACALWRQSSGKWRLLQVFAGISDVAWEPWTREFGAPHELLGP